MNYAASDIKMIMPIINYKECEGNKFHGGIKRYQKEFVTIAGLQAEIRIRDIPNTKQEYEPLYRVHRISKIGIYNMILPSISIPVGGHEYDHS
jgi:hypothetical protein